MSDPQAEKKVVIGIDPGTRITGYGIVLHDRGALSTIDYGCIRPPTHLELSDRYYIIFSSVEELILRHLPDALVVETQYVHKNPQSAIKLGMARGAVVIAARKNEVPIFEYAPTKAKLAIVGTGKASKAQVQGVLRHVLNLVEIPEPEDAADALALAVCHLNMMESKLYQ